MIDNHGAVRLERPCDLLQNDSAFLGRWAGPHQRVGRRGPLGDREHRPLTGPAECPREGAKADRRPPGLFSLGVGGGCSRGPGKGPDCGYCDRPWMAGGGSGRTR